jgi:hypothetical protein
MKGSTTTLLASSVSPIRVSSTSDAVEERRCGRGREGGCSEGRQGDLNQMLECYAIPSSSRTMRATIHSHAIS